MKFEFLFDAINSEFRELKCARDGNLRSHFYSIKVRLCFDLVFLLGGCGGPFTAKSLRAFKFLMMIYGSIYY